MRPRYRRPHTWRRRGAAFAPVEDPSRARHSLQAGSITIVDLLTAERDLASARYTMIQSTADLLTSSAAVAYAVGAVEMPTRP